MPYYLDPKTDITPTEEKETAYSLAELDQYQHYWDSVSSEITLLEDRFQLGVKQGMQAERYKIAEKLLKQSLSLELIQGLTGLTREEILSLDNKK